MKLPFLVAALSLTAPAAHADFQTAKDAAMVSLAARVCGMDVNRESFLQQVSDSATSSGRSETAEIHIILGMSLAYEDTLSVMGKRESFCAALGAGT